jgi:proteasome lid subunit RPN8/RPN11
MRSLLAAGRKGKSEGMTKQPRLLRKELAKLIKNANSLARKNGKEICGLLIDNGHFLELIQVRNRSKKGGSFSFDSREIGSIERAAKKLKHEILGTFHSHPYFSAIPGKSDLANVSEDEYMLIIDSMGKKASLWHVRNDRKKEIKFQLL